MANAPGTLPRRPTRADACRNYDRLVAVARQVFRERETDASLEEIARRAGVGIGTLYRNFPTRSALVEAVYVEDVEALEPAATDASGDPWQDLVDWLQRLLGYITTKKVLLSQLHDTVSKDSELMLHCREVLRRSAATVLAPAQEAGLARPDVDAADLLTLVRGLTMGPPASAEDTQRLLRVILDGLRAAPGRPS